jgi:hypothetical protein
MSPTNGGTQSGTPGCCDGRNGESPLHDEPPFPFPGLGFMRDSRGKVQRVGHRCQCAGPQEQTGGLAGCFCGCERVIEDSRLHYGQ